MNGVGEKFLPVGTVVLLKGAEKRLAITGFCAIDASDAEDNQTYDYVGVIFPEGSLSSDENILFNHDQIDKVFHLGLVDDEQKEFNNNLIKLINEGALEQEKTSEQVENQEGVNSSEESSNQAFPFYN